MTVAELIEKLRQFPGENRVVISGYEGGKRYIQEIEEIKLKLNVNTEWYYGEHEETEEEADCKAVSIS